jgi:hypothetical protein
MASDKKLLAKQIKEMERKAREEALKKAAVQEVTEQSEELVMFDVWYATRASVIPGKHMKEIIRADFTGRGLGNKETMAAFDMALEKYGVKLS